MKNKKLNTIKNPVVRIDNSLEKFKDHPFFQDKLNKANEMLKKTGLPAEVEADLAKKYKEQG